MPVAAESSFVRRALAEPEPPPLAPGGTLGFVRQRLFDGPLNAALTIAGLALIVLLGGRCSNSC